MPPTNPAVDSEPVPAQEPVEERALTDAEAMRKFLPHPPTAVMVKEALEELDTRKGVATLSIHSYIKQKYPSVDMGRSKILIRKALRKGLENGTFVRPPNSSDSAGAKGRFRLAPVKKAKPKNENTDPNVQTDPEPKDGAKDGPKKGKKTGATAKKEAKDQAKTEEEVKPPKRSKKAEGSATAKSAPAKKPKAKVAAVEKDGEEGSASTKPKAAGKAASTTKAKNATKTKEEKAEKVEKTAKASKSKAAKAASDAPASKATGKQRKKAAD